ncbi:aminotransferase class I/II-fold pyridoxal phosphate-dependent enzyme, partial [Reichenbachiella sp.]
NYCATLENAKMVEVCSTTLPQKALPLIQEHPEYQNYLEERRRAISERSEIISEHLNDIPFVTFNKTNGAFYNTIVFKDGSLNNLQKLEIVDPEAKKLAESWVDRIGEPDKRFVYYLLAAKGVCVVPLSSFQSELRGFRITLLEENKEVLHETFSKIADAINEFCTSDVKEEAVA